MILVAVDPGPMQSAYVMSHGDRILEFGKIANQELAGRMAWPFVGRFERAEPDHLAIERIVSRGIMPNDAVMTAEWVGRFIQAFAGLDESKYTAINRGKILGHFCGQYGNDKAIRDAMISRYGGMEVALDKGGKCATCKGRKGKRDECVCCQGTGRQHDPGPLVGITGDVISALAVSCFWWDCCAKISGAAGSVTSPTAPHQNGP